MFELSERRLEVPSLMLLTSWRSSHRWVCLSTGDGLNFLGIGSPSLRVCGICHLSCLLLCLSPADYSSALKEAVCIRGTRRTTSCQSFKVRFRQTNLLYSNWEGCHPSRQKGQLPRSTRTAGVTLSKWQIIWVHTI